MTRTTTLLTEDNLLSEQLQASLNFERIKIRAQDLQRARRYLKAAGEASRKYANIIKMVQEYDFAEMRGLAWTLVNSKEELLRMAVRNGCQYKAFMAWYQRILLKEVV